jgi:hypothetical protein
MSERWGRDRIAEVKSEDDGVERHRPPSSGRHIGNATTPPPLNDGNGKTLPPADGNGNGNGNGAMPAALHHGDRRPQTPADGAGSGRPPTQGNGKDAAPGNGSHREPEPEPLGSEVAALVAAPAAATHRSWLDLAAMLIVALVAMAASYGHMFEVAMMAGENIWIARMFPITVDGLVLVALRRGGPESRWWLALGIAVSVAANVAAAEPTIEGRLVAAWPPLCVLGTHRLLHLRTADLGKDGAAIGDDR